MVNDMRYIKKKFEALAGFYKAIFFEQFNFLGWVLLGWLIIAAAPLFFLISLCMKDD